MNPLVKVKAQAGETQITDSLHGFTWAGSAAVNLINDGTYGYLWRVSGGNLAAAIAGIGNWTDTTPKNTAIVLRFRINNRQAAYTRYCSVGKDQDNIQSMGNNGTSTGNIRGYMVLAGSAGNAGTFNYTNGAVRTVVIRFKETGTVADPVDTWLNTSGRVGTTPDASANNSVASVAAALSFINFNAAVGEQLDILNFAVVSDLTDAEAASLADDVSQLWPAANVDATAPATTVTGTSTINAGVATGGSGNVDATAPATAVTGTSTISAGVATGGNGTTGSFTTDTFENNTTSAHPPGTVIFWEWRVGNIGQAPTSVTYGPPGGTPLGAGSTMTLTGLPLGAGELWARDANDGRWCQPGTVT